MNKYLRGQFFKTNPMDLCFQNKYIYTGFACINVEDLKYYLCNR